MEAASLPRLRACSNVTYRGTGSRHLPQPAAGAADFPRRIQNRRVRPVEGFPHRAFQEAWVQLSADGKTSFKGHVLRPNETKAISATRAQVKVVTGNAGALTVSLNGKDLWNPLGPVGQVRVVRLTAEGPQFLSESQPPVPGQPAPAPDPL